MRRMHARIRASTGSSCPSPHACFDRFTIIKYVLEWIQLLFLVVSPKYGWRIDPNSWMWKIVSYINFMNPIINEVRVTHGFMVLLMLIDFTTL